MSQQESRVKKSLLNARVNLIFYFLTLALSFFSRKIFLDTLGADFVGLTTTLQNLLGFLNLAELGIGSAIGYVLYKPLFNHDEPKINEIISVFGFLYSRIGFIILGAGVVLAVMAVFLNVGLGKSAFYPSSSHLQSSLTIANASSSYYTLSVMAYVSLVIPFVLAYIVYVWRAMDAQKLTDKDLEGHSY